MGRQASGRRGNHQGALFYDKARGRWRAGVTLDDGQRRWVSGRTEAEAAKKMQALQGHAAAGTSATPGTLTVRKVIEHWQDIVLPSRRRAPATVEQYRWALELLTNAMGSVRLKTLSVEHVERFLQSMADEGYSRNSVRVVRATFAQVLDEAERRGHVGRNAARLAVLPADAAAPVERDTLSAEAVSRVLEASRGTEIEALVTVALAHGCPAWRAPRPGLGRRRHRRRDHRYH